MLVNNSENIWNRVDCFQVGPATENRCPHPACGTAIGGHAPSCSRFAGEESFDTNSNSRHHHPTVSSESSHGVITNIYNVSRCKFDFLFLSFGKSFYPFRNSIFMIPGMAGSPGGFHIGGGREIWKGLFTSAHVGQNFKALVNMDGTTTLYTNFVFSHFL